MGRYDNSSSDEKGLTVARNVKRHHLICLHKGPFNQYNTSPDKCCNDLWLKGLIESRHKQYCLDRMALLPDVDSPASSMLSLMQTRFSRGDVRPLHYLAIDEEIERSETPNISSSSYMQIRQIMARDKHKERESIRDLPNYGVLSYSPFHLVDFMPGGRDVSEYYDQVANGYEKMISLMKGNVNSTLSADGGMHRSFHQRVTLYLNQIKRLKPALSRKYKMEVNATVFLSLMESLFIDVDDPFIVEYSSDSAEPILCRSLVLSKTFAKDGSDSVPNSQCNIRFVSPKTIDIEQPSFASRQYVVAFQISATIEFTTRELSELMHQMQFGFDYGTSLHIRYLLPTISIHRENVGNMNGLTSVAIQHPILYSANACLMEGEGGNVIQYFVLDTAAGSETSDDSGISLMQEPIIIDVATGMDDDYWWVTCITMFSALVGGFVVMRSIDSVSIWT
jgi:hypothetical protein